MEVDPQSFDVRADSRLLMCAPAAKAPLTRRYLLPGVLRCDLLVIYKTDLAPYVGVDLDRMRAEALAVRDGRAVTTTNCRANEGVEAVVAAIEREVLFRA